MVSGTGVVCGLGLLLCVSRFPFRLFHFPLRIFAVSRGKVLRCRLLSKKLLYQNTGTDVVVSPSGPVISGEPKTLASSSLTLSTRELFSFFLGWLLGVVCFCWCICLR